MLKKTREESEKKTRKSRETAGRIEAEIRVIFDFWKFVYVLWFLWDARMDYLFYFMDTIRDSQMMQKKAYRVKQNAMNEWVDEEDPENTEQFYDLRP